MRPTILFDLGSPSETHVACLNGLQAYVDHHDLQWNIQLGPPQVDQIPANAVVLRDHPRQPDWVQETGHPQITVFGQASSTAQPCMRFKETAFGELAAKHLHDLGYRHCASIVTTATENKAIFQARRSGFQASCEKLGIRYTLFQHANQDKDQELLAWLRASQHPLGIYLPTDGQAAWLRQLVSSSKPRISGQLALIGTGNHIATCLELRPHLSSVSYPWPLMGKTIAHWIHRYLSSGVFPEPEELSPYQIVPRASTPMVAIKDPLVNAALTWLKRHHRTQAPLRDLADALDCSQETLCRHFKKSLGVSPQKMHNRFRLDRASELLLQSSLSIALIAQRVGFSSADTFTAAFKRRFDCNPSAWRRAAS